MRHKNTSPENLHLHARTGGQSSILPLLWGMLHQRESKTELMTLTPARATELYEDYRAGRMADVQRIWDELEMFDEDLAVVVDKRQRALEAMPWSIEIDAQAAGDDSTLTGLAEAQQACLQERFAAVENLREAVTYLGMADFHGVAALELTGNHERMRWEVIEPWLLDRPSRRGAWYYNPQADRQATTLDELDAAAVIIREARPLSLPAMFLIVAKQHAITGWDTFLDVFGNPSIFVELPAGTSQQDAAEMDALIKAIVADGRGTIPSGSKFTTVETGQTNCAAFQERARWCREAIITLGTGGQLTVMSAPGSGTLAGNAHQDSFEGLMAGTAASISAAINRQFTRRVLAEEFPGSPVLAKFTLAPEPQDETAAKAELLGKLTAAGYEMETDAAACELVGLPLRRTQVPAAMPGTPGMGGMSALANSCNQYGHDPNCPDGGGSATDSDPETAKLPRPAEDPEPEGGWEDDEEDPYADERDATALPAFPYPEESTAAATAEKPQDKSLPRRLGEKALAWMSRFVLPAKYARRAYEKKHGAIANSTHELADTETPAAEAPLTKEELEAFAALARPNRERFEAHRAEVEATLRRAADLDGEQGEMIANAGPGGENCEAKTPERCRCSDWRPIIKPAPISPKVAREKLNKGLKVKNPLGEEITLDKRILEHWNGASKTQEDINSRLSLLPLIEESVKSPAEIWQHDDGSHVYLASYVSMYEPGKKYTVAFTQRKDHTVIETYATNERVTSKKRQGKLLYSQKQPGASGT